MAKETPPGIPLGPGSLREEKEPAEVETMEIWF